MSRASDLANLIASGNTTIFGEAGAPTANAGQSNQTGGTTNLQQGLAKSWVTINQDGTDHPVYDSFNCTTTQDHGAGETAVSITNNMGNDNYTIIGSCQGYNDNGAVFTSYGKDSTDAMTTGTYRTDVRRADTGGGQDSKYVAIATHGDLA